MTHLYYPMPVRITWLLSIIFLFLIGTYNTAYAQNIVTNGTFNTNLTGWTAAGGWVRQVYGAASFASNNVDGASGQQLSQSLTGLNSGPVASQVTLTFTLMGGNYGAAGTSAQTGSLAVVLGGTTYATFTNTSSSSAISVSSANGATVTISPNPYTVSGLMGSTSAAVTVVIPWVSKPNIATLAFSYTAAGDDFGVDNVDIESCTAPTITTQPLAHTYCDNGTVSFTVTPAGTGPFTYQWQVSNDNGVTYYNESSTGGSGPVVSGAGTATLTYTSIPAAFGSRLFRVVVTNNCGSVTSVPAQLTLNVPPTVTAPPAAVTICSNGNATFTVTPAGGGPYTYQWQVSANGGASYFNESSTGGTAPVISGAGTASLTYANYPAAFGNRLFRVIVTNNCGSVTSAAALLTLNTAPAIVTQPTNTAICVNSPATFTAAASGTGLTYQWQLNSGAGWLSIPSPQSDGNGTVTGSTTASITVSPVNTNWNNFQYRVIVSGTCTPAVTSSAAVMTVNALPTITAQPAAASTCPNGNATFTVTPAGTAPFTYQWQVSVDGITYYNETAAGGSTPAVSGGTSQTVNYTNIPAAFGNRWFKVTVTNSCGSVTSTPVQLTISDAITATAPANATACANGTASFTTTADGAGPFTYQWEWSSDAGTTWANVVPTDITGTTSATLNITKANAGMANFIYRVKVTGTCGTATSASATLTVNALPVISAQPASQTLCVGTAANLSVTATGTGLTYQWQKNGTNITGATAATYSIAAVADADAANYDVVVTSNSCTVTSNVAVLIINTAPTITTAPAPITICANGNATFTVTPAGTGPFTYQWQVSADGGVSYFNESSTGGTAPVVSGAGTASLTYANYPAALGNRLFRVTVTNSCGTVTSPAALLTLGTPITPTFSVATASNSCPLTTVNIETLVNSTLPAGATLEFYTSNTPIPANLVAAPATVGAGTYYAFYKSTAGCYSTASASIVVSITAPCPLTDLRPLYVMADVGYIKPSALTKNATLRLYNVGNVASVSAGLITVYIYPPNNQFSIALGAAPGWAITYDAGGNYYTLTSTSTTVAYGAANFQSVPLVITAAPTVSNGKYTFNFEVADGSGGETNNLNNTVPIEVTVSSL